MIIEFLYGITDIDYVAFVFGCIDMQRRMGPVLFMVSKAMFNGIEVDVKKGFLKLNIGYYGFTFEARVKKRASSGVEFIYGF